MRIWKMIGCLGLLVVLISSCVVLATPTQVSAKESEQAEQPTQAPTTEEKSEAEEQTPLPEQSVTVEKTYSQGLCFRSNGDGTCALSGLGECKDTYLLIPPKSPSGDIVTEILTGALSGSTVSAVEIPVSVNKLCADAFQGCSRLAHVRVATGSKSFLVLDGALYTADGQTLLYCPVARGARELTLHTALLRIAAGAFAECPDLTTIYFSGSTADWRNILIGDDNDALYEAAFKFNS